jgi:hypothetical protein
MAQIRSLYDPAKGIERSIEKVISYQASQEARLKAEISEYIVTDSIEDQLEKLLLNMQSAMDAGAGHEIGVWVSGFYGSGKSSFTKYLGLAFDQRVVVEGQPFLRHLQDRLTRPQTKALLSTVAARFPAAVVMLDLASEQIAGATLAEVSTVLYYKVLQYAGYSRNLKVAALERRLRKEGRFGEFEAIFRKATGEEWADYQNDELVVDSLLPRIAHQLYPSLFRDDYAFTTATSEVIYLMNDRVQEMIDIVRESAGKEYLVFVIDEIGQYVGANQNKILDLQGLSENLKNLGQGKVWIIGTAQQTLTEDDPRAAINSPQLFKLKDRFPISVELESSDIREICHRRLLGKSSAGDATLGSMFDMHGQALRQNTKLTDAKFYDSAFDRKAFIELYPFLPAHFDILLHLLGALAKSTGGIGLRSAIKVVQDILVEDIGGEPPVADRDVGWLATSVTLYDALDKDIARAFPSVHQAVDRVRVLFVDDGLVQDVAKTIGILQILGNMPATEQNIAGLMQSAVDAGSLLENVKRALEAMQKNPLVPLGDKDGSFRFFSEKLHDIEQERSQIPLRTVDVRRIFNEALGQVFDPLPSARISGSLSVTSGLRHLSGGQVASLAGDRETVQTVVTFADPADYAAERDRLLDESRHRSSTSTIYLIGRTVAKVTDLVSDIYRSQRIVELHRNDPDQEVREYCAGQADRAVRDTTEASQLLTRSLAQGSFVFRGSVTAVDSLDQSLTTAAKKLLAEAGSQIFDRYQEAPERAGTDLAEKFLRAASANLRSITSQLDPLGLVKVNGGTGTIDSANKALVSIRDYIERSGTVEGRRLLDAFSDLPFGWSQDTTRYLVAALLVAGEVKLKVAGREVTVNGQQAIDALKTNNTFKPVGVSLREDRPSMDVLAKAAERLTDLCGDQVLPLEEDISKAARKLLPRMQQSLGPLAERMGALRLPGVETLESLTRQMEDMLLSDASDAPQRFGAEDSLLYVGLKWGQAARVAFDHGLGDVVRALRDIQRYLAEMPNTGSPGELKAAVRDELDAVEDRLKQDDFYRFQPDLNSSKTAIEGRIAEAVRTTQAAIARRLEEAELDFQAMPEWSMFTAEERGNTLSELQAMEQRVDSDLTGLKHLISLQYDIEQTIAAIKLRVRLEAQARLAREREAHTSTEVDEPKVRVKRSLSVPSRIQNTTQLDSLVQRLQELRLELSFADIEIVIDEE